MTDYEDTLKDIEASLGLVPGFMKALPADVLMADWPLMKKHVLGESKIPGKYREMIALAVSANLKCPYCELFHTGASQLHGASEDELKEVYFLASFTTRWSAMIHAQHYDYDKFKEEFAQIAAHLSK
jgi:AhpD family alkylhydroperoxidase